MGPYRLKERNDPLRHDEIMNMSTKYTIKSVTGTFKNATGKLEDHGEADTK